MKTQVDEKELDRQRQIMQDLARRNEGRGLKAMVVTLGCQQNKNDSELLCGMLEKMGYGFTDERDAADLILFNTCAVRDNAEQTVLGKLGALKGVKRKRPGLMLGICGCMAQQAHVAETIKAKYRHVDMVFGTHSLYKFPQILQEAVDRHETVVDILSTDGTITENLPILREETARAWVSVMYGCNNFCSYCIVPYVRGRERSRRPEDILAEITALAENGCREVTLLGQNVNSYGKDLDEPLSFAQLLERVSAIAGLRRIRFMTSHPKDLDDAVLEVMARHDNICNHLHLPVQAGSDRVLKDMNRKYSTAQYLQIIEKARANMPDLTLTTDIIVGFPTETNEDFEGTLALLKAARYDTIFSFIYSKRQGTPAANMPMQLTEEEISANFNRLLEVQNAISLEKNQAMVGSVQEIMVEGESKTNPDVFSGRTEGNKIVNFVPPADCDRQALKNSFIKVRITGAHTWSLMGEME